MKSDNNIIRIRANIGRQLPQRALSPKLNKQYMGTKNENSDFFTNKIVSNIGKAKNFCKKFDSFPSEEDITRIKYEIFEQSYNGFEEGIKSNKSNGIIKSYALNTYMGLVRDYNEDKIIVVNPIKKPANSNNRNWPKMSYFGIFDGHGGDTCAIFLRDNLLNFIVEAKEFPVDIKAAMAKGFERAEYEFFKMNEGKTETEIDNSGSCALALIIAESKMYIGNVGDSRAILSLEGGTKIKPLTIDHKPNNPKEFARIVKSGAKVFVDDDGDNDDNAKLKYIDKVKDFDIYCNSAETVFREYPSEMSVSRTMGDIKYKKKEFKGVPGSIISTPDIYMMDIYNYYDFIVMGCDGIYDFLNNSQVIDSALFIIQRLCKEKNYDIHALTKDACDMVIKYALKQMTEDNLSCIIIGLEGLEKIVKTQFAKEKINHIGK